MLTLRQLKIIAILLGASGELSTEYISNLLDVSTKTVQNDLQHINLLLPHDPIRYRHGKGYHITLSDETRQKLSHQFTLAKTEQYEFSRGNYISLVLSFEKDYISMEQLAKKLFLSKSAISHELDRYWRVRRTVTISHKYGLKIALSESKIRSYLGNTAILGENILGVLNLKEEFELYFQPLWMCVAHLFIKNNVKFSGKQMQEFVQYLFFLVVRKIRGFEIEQQLPILQESPLLEKLIRDVEALTPIQFNLDDRISMNEKMLQMSEFKPNERHTLSMPSTHQITQSFLGNLSNIISKSIVPDDLWNNRFYIHLEKMFLRLQNQESYPNFSKRKMNQQFPLAAQLVRDAFYLPEKMTIRDSELSYLIPYVEILLTDYRDSLPSLLVTDLSPSLVYPLEYELNKKLISLGIEKLNVIPTYYFEQSKETYLNTYQIILTTETELAFLTDNIIAIKKIMTDSDYDMIYQQIKKMSLLKQNEQLTDFRNDMIQSKQFIVEKVTPDVFDTILQKKTVQHNTGKYKLVMEENIAYFPIFSNNQSSYIHIYIRDSSEHKGGNQVNYLISSVYNPKCENIFLFYSLIQSFLVVSKLRTL